MAESMEDVSDPAVGIIMGSASDMPVIQKAEVILERFGVSFETRVLSAHRMPDQATEYAKYAVDRGLKVIIAGAGRAAHLAGAMAANTTLPVIGVPVFTEQLGGADALYSTVQMPPGVPVATVGLDGSVNAAVLAVQILATSDLDLAAKLREFKQELAQGLRF
ncbi:MAG: 5-(carboxyamino)imidazole ribonucleotide mutase [Actinomycetota bacterium]